MPFDPFRLFFGGNFFLETEETRKSNITAHRDELRCSVTEQCEARIRHSAPQQEVRSN
ncbi:hypothetical protein BIW11_02431 [Tropilaelaps mercedesae]|uniref:Uncharacterized protein n=1 Tax=Tropilaelaps mercedesae TaxID=418985 RepID=A0A1V9Y3C4_9ACAR|nr:hypothetical protein BIW11_02431 [Tropilaelaps mercedesae]